MSPLQLLNIDAVIAAGVKYNWLLFVFTVPAVLYMKGLTLVVNNGVSTGVIVVQGTDTKKLSLQARFSMARGSLLSSPITLGSIANSFLASNVSFSTG